MADHPLHGNFMLYHHHDALAKLIAELGAGHHAESCRQCHGQGITMVWRVFPRLCWRCRGSGFVPLEAGSALAMEMAQHLKHLWRELKRLEPVDAYMRRHDYRLDEPRSHGRYRT